MPSTKLHRRHHHHRHSLSHPPPPCFRSLLVLVRLDQVVFFLCNPVLDGCRTTIRSGTGSPTEQSSLVSPAAARPGVAVVPSNSDAAAAPAQSRPTARPESPSHFSLYLSSESGASSQRTSMKTRTAETTAVEERPGAIKDVHLSGVRVAMLSSVGVITAAAQKNKKLFHRRFTIEMPPPPSSCTPPRLLLLPDDGMEWHGKRAQTIQAKSKSLGSDENLNLQHGTVPTPVPVMLCGARAMDSSQNKKKKKEKQVRGGFGRCRLSCLASPPCQPFISGGVGGRGPDGRTFSFSRL